MNRTIFPLLSALAVTLIPAGLPAQDDDRAARQRRDRRPRVQPTHANISYGNHPRNVLDHGSSDTGTGDAHGVDAAQTLAADDDPDLLALPAAGGIYIADARCEKLRLGGRADPQTRCHHQNRTLSK